MDSYEISRLVDSCSLKLKHFMFRRNSWRYNTTIHADDKFDSLQNAAQLESLTLEIGTFEAIVCLEKILPKRDDARR